MRFCAGCNTEYATGLNLWLHHLNNKTCKKVHEIELYKVLKKYEAKSGEKK